VPSASFVNSVFAMSAFAEKKQKTTGAGGKRKQAPEDVPAAASATVTANADSKASSVLPKLWIVSVISNHHEVDAVNTVMVSSHDKDASGEPAMTSDIEKVLICVNEDFHRQNRTVYEAFCFLFCFWNPDDAEITEKTLYEPPEVYDAACRILKEKNGKYADWCTRFKTNNGHPDVIGIPACCGARLYTILGRQQLLM
jgi:hypothetical protein